jgi:hypothetical protein
MSDTASTGTVPAETEYELEKFWRRLRPNLRLTAPTVTHAPRVENGGPTLPDVPNFAEPLVPVDDLCIARGYLESLPTRPLNYARRVRFERHIAIDGRPLGQAEQVLFPRSVRLRLFRNPLGFVFGREGVDPSFLTPSPTRNTWRQLQRLHLNLAAMWRGAATLPKTLGGWSRHPGVVITLSRGNAPYHAAIGFRSGAPGAPDSWYSWVPAARPFVARHSIDELIGGCPYHGAPVVAVYVVTTP